jgi:hypothetical protein
LKYGLDDSKVKNGERIGLYSVVTGRNFPISPNREPEKRKDVSGLRSFFIKKEPYYMRRISFGLIIGCGIVD